MHKSQAELLEIAVASKASQDWFELYRFLLTAQTVNPNIIVEIGVDKGHLMSTWCDAFSPSLIFGIDITLDNFADEPMSRQLDECVIVGDSGLEQTRQQLLDYLGPDEIDLLFIDGDHSYDAAIRDFELYSPLVRSGGIVAFHDTLRAPGQYAGVDTRRVFIEVSQRYPSIEFAHGPVGGGTPGIGVVFV